MELEAEEPGRKVKVRFGLFEADLATGELRKSGVRIRLQAQPFRVLTFLLEKPGEVITREEIQQRLWGNDTIVDFDHSLGTAINKLREALGDSAENPRFIETLARRGYRFLAPVTVATPAGALTAKAEAVDNLAAAPQIVQIVPLSEGKPSISSSWSSKYWRSIGIFGGVALLLLVGAFVVGREVTAASAPPPHITQVTYTGRVSAGDPQFESLPATATDGSRIYFPEMENGRAMLAEALIADGETSTLAVPEEIAAPSLGDISPDGSKLLLRNHLLTEAEQALWIVSTISGTARRIPGILAHDATWMPDGQRILYASGNDLFVAKEDGSEGRRFASVPGRAFWLRWAPDGRELRFTLLDSVNHTTRLWQISAEGDAAHPLLANWESPAAECCGSWTPDGRYFIFQSSRNGDSNLWQMEENPGWLSSAAPVQITNGPLSYQGPITARSGDGIFFIGLNRRSELLGYDAQNRIFVPYSAPLSNARRVEFSRDGKWVAWIKQDDDTLWRSKRDGSERMQLTEKPMAVFMMHWSPDGRQLLLMGREPGKSWRVYTVDAEGGKLQTLLDEGRNEADPDWSPDETKVVFGRMPELMAEESQPKAIYMVTLGNHQPEQLPGSDGLFSPRWSPDGRYIAALSLDESRLMLFDTVTRTWRMAVKHTIADPVWASDGKSIFFYDFVEDSQPIYKFTLEGDRLEKVADLRDLRAADVVDYRFAGLAPGDIPLVNALLSTANIYSAEVRKR